MTRLDLKKCNLACKKQRLTETRKPTVLENSLRTAWEPNVPLLMPWWNSAFRLVMISTLKLCNQEDVTDVLSLKKAVCDVSRTSCAFPWTPGAPLIHWCENSYILNNRLVNAEHTRNRKAKEAVSSHCVVITVITKWQLGDCARSGLSLWMWKLAVAMVRYPTLKWMHRWLW